MYGQTLYQMTSYLFICVPPQVKEHANIALDFLHYVNTARHCGVFIIQKYNPPPYFYQFKHAVRLRGITLDISKDHCLYFLSPSSILKLDDDHLLNIDDGVN